MSKIKLTGSNSGYVEIDSAADAGNLTLQLPTAGTTLLSNADNVFSGITTFTGLNITDDVTFNGASYNVVWDKSDNQLEFGDSAKLAFGASSDLQIFHDTSATNNVISGHTGSLNLRNYDTNSTDINLSTRNDILLQTAINESSIWCDANAGVHIYYNGAQKFVTTTDGVQVTGEVVSGTLHCSGKLDLPDSPNATVGRVLLGDSDDLQLYHDGSQSYVSNNTGNLNLTSTGAVVTKVNTSEDAVVCNANGSVDLYHDNTKKFETTSSGATITGNLAFPSGNGIDFSATSGTPSNGGELLDDYEEGNFTASLGGLSNWSSYSVTGQGHYVKIGKAVHININFGNVDLNNSASGSVIIFNLPFVPFVVNPDCRGVTSNYMAHKVQHANDGMIHSFYIHPTYGFKGQITKNNTSWTSWDASNFTATGVYLDFSATYFTAS